MYNTPDTMKDCYLLTTFLLFTFLFKGCMSREERFYRDKALESINNGLIKTLNKTEIYRQCMDYFADTMVLICRNHIR